MSVRKLRDIRDLHGGEVVKEGGRGENVRED